VLRRTGHVKLAAAERISTPKDFKKLKILERQLN
jgi:hypothetical protein